MRRKLMLVVVAFGALLAASAVAWEAVFRVSDTTTAEVGAVAVEPTLTLSTSGAAQPPPSAAVIETTAVVVAAPVIFVDVSTTADPIGAEPIVFELEGGSVGATFSPEGVTVEWAEPQPGFETKIEPEGAGVKVEFRGGGHRSRIDLWWADGPQHSIRERAD